MRRTSGNIMNELGRSILSLYSYDPDPDDLSVDNLLRQSVELIGYFPSIVANAYASSATISAASPCTSTTRRRDSARRRTSCG